MAVDYEEGRRLLAALDAAFELGETPDRVRAKDDMVGWLLFHAEALLNPVSAAPSPAPDDVEAVANVIVDHFYSSSDKAKEVARAAIAALRQRAAMDDLLRMDGELYDVSTNQEPRND